MRARVLLYFIFFSRLNASVFLLTLFYFFLQMATTKPLTSEAIALTEKKMDMTLGVLLV